MLVTGDWALWATWVPPIVAILPFVIPAVASALGALAVGRGQGRQEAAQTALQGDQQALNRYLAETSARQRALEATERGALDRADLDLERRGFALGAPGARGRNALLGDFLSQAQDVTISHPRATIPQISGGFTPSSLTPETRQLGSEITRQALMSQLEGDDFEPVARTDFAGAVRPAPAASPLPQPNAFDRFLGVAAPLAAIAGAGAEGVQAARTAERNRDLVDRLISGQTVAGQQAGFIPFGTQTPVVIPPAPPQFAPNLNLFQGG